MNFIEWLKKKQQEEKQKQQQQQQQEAAAYDSIMSTGAGSEKYIAKKQVQQQNNKSQKSIIDKALKIKDEIEQQQKNEFDTYDNMMSANSELYKLKMEKRKQNEVIAEKNKAILEENKKRYQRAKDEAKRLHLFGDDRYSFIQDAYNNQTYGGKIDEIPYVTTADIRNKNISNIDTEIDTKINTDPNANDLITQGASINPLENDAPTYDEMALSTLGLDSEDSYITNFRDYLNPDELRRLNYLLGDQKKNGVDHSQSIKDYSAMVINRAGQAYEDKRYETGDYVHGNFYLSSPIHGLTSGTIGGIGKTMKRLFGDISPTVTTAEEMAYQDELNKSTGFKKIAGLVLYNGGQITSSVLLGGGYGSLEAKAARAGTNTMMFLTTAGNSYDNVIKNGYTDREALTYAIMDAGMEVLLTKIGGKLAGGIEQLAGTKSLLKNAIKTTVKNPIDQRAVNKIINMASEGTEEYIQQVFNPIVKNIALGEDNKFKLNVEGGLTAFLVGFLTAGAVNATCSNYGLKSDVLSYVYKIRNPEGNYLSADAIYGVHSGNPIQDNILEYAEWIKPFKEQGLEEIFGRIKNIAEVEIGGKTYSEICKATANMNKGEVIDYYFSLINSPKYKQEVEQLKARKEYLDKTSDVKLAEDKVRNRIYDIIGKNTGVELSFINDANENVGGYFDDKNNKIVINSNSKNPMLVMLMREITHNAQLSKFYPALKDAAFKDMENKGIDVKAAEDKIREDYKDYNLSDKGVEQEIVSKYVGGMLLGNEADVIDFVLRNKTFAGKLYGLVSKFAVKDKAFMEAKNNLAKAILAGNEENVSSPGEAVLQYDIGEGIKSDEVNTEENVINEQNDIANGDEVGYKREEGENALDLKRAESYTSKGLLKSIKEKGYDFERVMRIISIDDPAKIPQEDKDYVIGMMRDIGVPKVGETIRKIIPKVKYKNILRNKTIKGFIANAEHVSSLNIFDVIHKALRLEANEDFNENDDFYIEYFTTVTAEDKLAIPINKNSGQLKPPCNGLGATASIFGIFPEYFMRRRGFQDGDILNLRDSKTGEKTKSYRYDRDEGWIEE
ncbi:MAG: hypothetical protein GYA50_04810 [Eubacteriaceae bacterium]|nr:hypothetical protein [Eubacteriaceae bacterium]